MIRLAPIAPPHEKGGFALTSYQMALGQWIVTHPLYLMAMRISLHRRRGFVIVDNGAAEPENERVPFSAIYTITKIFLPTAELVAPDVMRDGDATFKATTQAFKEFPWKRYCVVPQGSTWEEWQDCVDRFMAKPIRSKFVTVAVPKHLESLPGGRPKALDYLINKWGVQQIQLLGFYKKPLQEAAAASKYSDYVRGIDSGAMFAYASNMKVINDDEHFSLDPNSYAPYKLFQWNYARVVYALQGVNVDGLGTMPKMRFTKGDV